MEVTLSAARALPRSITVRRGVYYLFLSLLSASLLTASFPPFDLGILAWFGLAPLLFALRRAGPVAGAGLAFLFGCLFGIGGSTWISSIPEVNLFNYIVIIIIFSLYFLVFGLLYRSISNGIGSWIIVGAPALWVTLEYTRANLFFLSWPWHLLGHSQYSYLPVIQIADISGVYGISFLIVMANQFLSQLPDLKKAIDGENSIRDSNLGPHAGKVLVTHFLVVSFTLAVFFLYGWHRLSVPQSNQHLRVAIAQANVLTRDDMAFADKKEHLGAYERLSKEASVAKPDLIVWPAASLPAPIKASRLVSRTMKRLANQTGCYFLVGGSGYEKFAERQEGYTPYSNSEFLISPSGHIKGQYNKIRLLPFNEYLPLEGKITWPRWITTLKKSFLPGEEYMLFEVEGARFGTPICWENMFPDDFRRFVKDGANFMVSVTNDGFFGRTSGPHQTLAINVFRAVENRVAIARAAPTGVSAFINPDGEIVERVRDGNGEDLFVAGFLVRNVPLMNEKTFYTVYGDIFAYGDICLAALIIVASLLAHKQNGLRSRC